MLVTDKKERKIVLTGGGTAGHVLPHFALLPYLKKTFGEINYIGSADGVEKKLVEQQGLPFHSVTCVKLRRSMSLKNFAIPYKLMKGISEAKKILRELQPDIVFSKGGFVAYPVVRAAAKLGIPVVAHESDMTMGLANKVSVKYCEKVCTTFADTVKTDGKSDGKFVYTGSPIRAKIYKGNPEVVVKRHHLPAVRNLLIIGGSLGATRVNEAVRAALPDLTKAYNVIHVCGRGKTENIKCKNYVQMEYVDDIENYLAWADVVVSRAGSNALCELMVLGKAVLFIPLSTGRGDQIENVMEVLQRNAGRVLYEENLNSASLVEGVDNVWDRREEFGSNARKMGTDGTQAIAEILSTNLTRLQT